MTSLCGCVIGDVLGRAGSSTYLVGVVGGGVNPGALVTDIHMSASVRSNTPIRRAEINIDRVFMFVHSTMNR